MNSIINKNKQTQTDKGTDTFSVMFKRGPTLGAKNVQKILENWKAYQMTTKKLASSEAAIHKCPYKYSETIRAGR